MIDSETRRAVKQATDEFWHEHVKNIEFSSLASGKEIGHRIADYVDDRTTEMLESKFDTRHELDARGKRRPRSMGDLWILSNGIYNPINVKAGEFGKNGQPNMVSLTKLLDQLLLRHIDSYDLLIVKMRIEGIPASAEVDPSLVLEPSVSITPNVYFVDMLDYLDYITFDAGPGQAMLREKQFYDALDQGIEPESLSLDEKVEKCMELMEDGDRRLIENRRKKMARIRRDVEAYKLVDGHSVEQNGLNLG